MQVNPYIRPLLDSVTDLANRPARDAGDLAKRWATHGVPAPRTPDASDLRRVRAFLRGWAGVVDAPSEVMRVANLNALLRRYASPPTITDHDDSGWHLHHRPDGAGFGVTFTAATATAAAQYLTEHGMHRLGRCALDECSAAFVDFSRPGKQRYCSPGCANRDAVRRHRAR